MLEGVANLERDTEANTAELKKDDVIMPVLDQAKLKREDTIANAMDARMKAGSLTSTIPAGKSIKEEVFILRQKEEKLKTAISDVEQDADTKQKQDLPKHQKV